MGSEGLLSGQAAARRIGGPEPPRGGFMRRIGTLATVTLASFCALSGCRKQADPGAQAVSADASVTEQGENGSVSWNVDSDGKIRGTLKANDGHPITKDVVGTLIWPGEVTDEER